MPESTAWPNIIWVAAHPPVPPFAGNTLKSQSGIDALSSVTSMQVVTFATKEDRDTVAARFREYWRKYDLDLHLSTYGQRGGMLQSALARKYQFGQMIEQSDLPAMLSRLDWSNRRNLVLFDDIIFAPFLHTYGANAMISPHDCISAMHRSHARLTSGGSRLKHYFQYLIGRHYESDFYGQALLVHVVTHRERLLLQGINPKARYHVAPYAVAAHPASLTPSNHAWDILIWADFRTTPLAHSARRVLEMAVRDDIWLSQTKILIVGRVPKEQAEQFIGKELLARVEYAQYFESVNASLHQAKIIFIPDESGAGMKSRCVEVLASGRCLACVYKQMEGLDEACDRGAINASNLEELLERSKVALQEGTYATVAEAGARIYAQYYGSDIVQHRWREMVQRAVAIREWSDHSGRASSGQEVPAITASVDVRAENQNHGDI